MGWRWRSGDLMATLKTVFSQRGRWANGLIGLGHRLGVTPLMWRARRAARVQGARLSFRRGSVRWRRGGDVLLFPVNEPYLLGRRVAFAEYVLGRGVPDEREGIRIFDTRGPMRYRLPSGRPIWLPGPIEPSNTFGGYVSHGAPERGQAVWDIGAFCGETTVEFSRLVGPEGHVFALEPDPANRVLLQRNLEMHEARNVTILPCAIWGEDGMLSFGAAGDCGSALTGLDGAQRRFEKEIKVEAVSPASLLARAGRAPDFIKMDIEGAEVEALAALAPWLAEAGRTVRLAVASYHLREGRPTHELITGPLEAAGFTVETGNPEHVTTWAWREEAKNR